MAKVPYDKQLTALLVIDPSNDPMCEGCEKLQLFRGNASSALR